MSDTVELHEGDVAPDFTLTDDAGNDVTLSAFRGQRVIVYFYPKAQTPGCTIQACDFRDNLNALTAAGVVVLGLSPDSPEELAAFREHDNLTFPLLSDPDRKAIDAYGVWGTTKFPGGEFTGVVRSTFVVDPEGNLEKAMYRVAAQGHVAMLREELSI